MYPSSFFFFFWILLFLLLSLLLFILLFKEESHSEKQSLPISGRLDDCPQVIPSRYNHSLPCDLCCLLLETKYIPLSFNFRHDYVTSSCLYNVCENNNVLNSSLNSCTYAINQLSEPNLSSLPLDLREIYVIGVFK